MPIQRLLKWMLAAALIVAAGFVTIGLFLPDRLQVQHQIQIKAPPARVFEQLAGLTDFDQWSPWGQMDPAMHYQRSGPEQGVGARIQWRSSNPSIGSGSQQIEALEAPRWLRMQMSFEGRKSQIQTLYTLTPEAEATRLTWEDQVDFKGDFIGRYFGLVLRGALGNLQERGLAQLKNVLEGADLGDN